MCLNAWIYMIVDFISKNLKFLQDMDSWLDGIDEYLKTSKENDDKQYDKGGKDNLNGNDNDQEKADTNGNTNNSKNTLNDQVTDDISNTNNNGKAKNDTNGNESHDDEMI